MDSPLFIGFVGVVVVQFGLLWYRLGKLEQKLIDLCREVRKANNKDSGGQ